MSIKFNPLIFGGFDLTGGGAAGAVEWKSPVADESSLPMAGNSPGDARIALDTDKIYVWDDTTSKWIDTELTKAAFGSIPNAEGITLSTTDVTVGAAEITRQTINLEPADATNPGAVSIDSQTFAGDKAFIDLVDAQGGVVSTTGVLTLGGSGTVNIDIQNDIAMNGYSAYGALSYSATDPSSGTASVFSGIGVQTNTTENDETYIYTVSSTAGDIGIGLLVQQYDGAGNAGDVVVSAKDIRLGTTGAVKFEEFDAGAYTQDEYGSISSNGGTMSITAIGDLSLSSSDGLAKVEVHNELTMESNKIINLADGENPSDAINLGQLLAQDALVKEPTGFPNRTDSVLSFSDSSPDRTFSISPTGVSFDFYIKGVKFTKTSTDSLQIPNLPGDHYIYYDDNGVLQSTQVFSSAIIQEYAFISIVYWNTDTSTHTYFAEERHGLVMDGATHAYLHTVLGARFLSGLALQGFTVDGTGDNAADAQFTSDSGTIRDEDILHQIAAQAQIPILFRQGQQWRKKASDVYPIIYNGTAGYVGTRAPYNQYTGGAWQLTEVQDSKFVLVHFFGTNDIDNPFVGIQGINQYDSIEAARIGANAEISSLSGLPFAEFVPVGSVIFQTRTVYSNTPKARVRSTDTGASYVDFRGSQLYTPAGTATTHGLLSGLSNDDHFQYLLVDGTRAMSGALDMGTHLINNVVDPSSAQDAATKNYVDNAVTGTTSYFAGFDSTTGVLTEVPGFTFDDNGGLQIGAQNSITVPPGITDYISIGISPTVSNPGLANLSGVQLNSPIDSSITNYNGFQTFGYGTAAPDNFIGYLSQPGYSGASDNVTHFSASGSVNCTGDLVGMAFQSSSDATTITAVNAAPSGDATTFNGIIVAPTGNLTDATGLKVDYSSATITNRPSGLDISGGTLNSTVSFTTTSNLPTLVDSANIIRPVFEVEAGSPIIGTDVLMTNLAGFMDFKADHGYSALELGVASVGYVSQVAADSGVIVEKISMSLAGLAIDSTSAGGTILEASLYSGSAFNFGGSLGIDNLYGLKIDNTLSDKATNTWGISVEDSGAENYLAKSLVIGGPSKTTSSVDIALEISSPKTIKLAEATTAEISSLSNLDGSIIFDSDLKKFFGAALGFWTQLNLSRGDLDQTTRTALDNQPTPDNITDFSFSSPTRGFEAVVTVERGAAYAEYSLKGIRTASWEMSQDYVGDDTGVVFSITSGGQIQYTSTNTGVNATINFRAWTV